MARSPLSRSAKTFIAITSSTSPSCRRALRSGGRLPRADSPARSRRSWSSSVCSRWKCFFAATAQLLVNELAPRPHNSGHWTIEGCATSQFEQHVRAVCGLPLGSTEMLRRRRWRILLGDLWQDGEPDWAAALAVEGVHLHLYGKHEPRPRRKMGHLTALASNAEAAIARCHEGARRAQPAGSCEDGNRFGAQAERRAVDRAADLLRRARSSRCRPKRFTASRPMRCEPMPS